MLGLQALYKEGHIQGSRSLPFEAFDQLADEVLIDLPEDTLIITYCDGEKCTLSAELAQKLKQIGFENVRVLFNGWTVWKDIISPLSLNNPGEVDERRQP